jgi:hypothetical protein
MGHLFSTPITDPRDKIEPTLLKFLQVDEGLPSDWLVKAFRCCRHQD